MDTSPPISPPHPPLDSWPVRGLLQNPSPFSLCELARLEQGRLGSLMVFFFCALLLCLFCYSAARVSPFRRSCRCFPPCLFRKVGLSASDHPAAQSTCFPVFPKRFTLQLRRYDRATLCLRFRALANERSSECFPCIVR